MSNLKGTNFVAGSGDVFADLGFTPMESRELHLRSAMMTALRKHIASEGLTQTEAAKLLKLSLPEVSDLAGGKMSRFSLHALMIHLTQAGITIDVDINDASGGVANSAKPG